ncbi:MAG: hypothetical protein ACHQ2Y_09830, partial [Candidatus Lutacidiplasmatales archaeon]
MEGTFPSREEVALPGVPLEELGPVITEALTRQGYGVPTWAVPSPAHPAWTPAGRVAYCAAESSLRLDRRNARIADGLVIASILSMAVGLSLGVLFPTLAAHRSLVILFSVLGPCVAAILGFVVFPSQFRSDLVVVRLEAPDGVEWPPAPVGFFGLKHVEWPPMPAVSKVVIEAGSVLTENLASRLAAPTR